MAEERDYGMFDDDAEDLAPEETVEESEKKKKKKKKKKIDKEGSKKNKKGKGIRRPLVKIVIGGIVLFVAASLFNIRSNNNGVLTPTQHSSDNCFMGVYTPYDHDPDTYYLDDYYIYSENGDNYLVRFDKGVDGAYSVLDDAVIEGIGKRDDGVTPLEGTQLLEDIIASSSIEGQAKGFSDEVNTFVVYADGNVIASKLASDACLDDANGYEFDGQTYTDIDDYIEAVYKAKTAGMSK